MTLTRRFRNSLMCWSRHAKGGVVSINKAFRVFDPTLQPAETEMGPQNWAIGQLAPGIPRILHRNYRMNFQSEFRGSAVADAVPVEGPLLRACGFAEASSGSSPNIVYTYTRGDPRLTTDSVAGDVEPITINFYKDGLKQVLTGCVGNAKFEWPAGRIPFIEFDLFGKMASDISHGEAEETEATPTETFTPDATPVPCGNYGLTFDGVSGLTVRRIAYDCGWDFGATFNLNGDVHGMGQPLLGVPNGLWELEIYLEALGTLNLKSLFQAQSEIELAFTHNPGGAAREICDITGTGVIIAEPEYDQDERGIAFARVRLAENPASGDALTMAWQIS